MNKRRRMKLRRGEFTDYGFDATFKVDQYEESFPLFDRIIDWAESRGLSVGGGVGERCSLYVHACGCPVCGRKYETANDEDRASMLTFLQSAGADEIQVWPLVDSATI